MTWKNAGPEEKAAIVKLISRSYPAFKRDPERCLVDTLELPFYPGGKLARLSARDVPGSLLWYTCLAETAIAMHGGLSCINEGNAAAPLMIKEETVHSYVRYHYYFTDGSRLFESKVKRSAVGYSGKIWIFEKEKFFEIDVNISPRGILTELEKIQLHDIPQFVPGDFDL